MEKKIKVLHIVSALNNGGVESMLLNYYKEIDRNQIQFDFITHDKYVGNIEEKLIQLDSRIFRVVSKKQNIFKYFKGLKMILKNNNYDIVHIHQNYMSFIPLYYSKKYGIKNRIIHSHTCIDDETYIKKKIKIILSSLCKKYANRYAACGISAAEWLYGKKFIEENNIQIIDNGLDIEKFLFNDFTRDEIRYRLKIENKFIIGHIGRFTEEKNHSYIIDICEILKKRYDDFVVILIGDGLLKSNIEQKIKELNLDKHIILLGNCDNVNELLNAIDILLLPSKYEGFPLTLIEAQASGLKCIVSDRVPNDVFLTKNIYTLPIKNSDKESWVQCILDNIGEIEYSRTIDDNVRNYEIKKLSSHLLKYYKSINK